MGGQHLEQRGDLCPIRLGTWVSNQAYQYELIGKEGGGSYKGDHDNKHREKEHCVCRKGVCVAHRSVGMRYSPSLRGFSKILIRGHFLFGTYSLDKGFLAKIKIY